MASFYGPQMQRFGQAEGTNPWGGPAKGAGAQTLQGFRSYDDYMKAFKANPMSLAGSTGVAGSGAGFSGFDPRSGQYVAETGMGGRPMQRTGYNPFTQAQWQQAEQGRQIASGEAMLNASRAAAAALPDDVLNYASKFGGGNELMDFYKKALTGNPDDFTNTQEYQWLKKEQDEAVRRTSPRLSGARAIAAMDRSGNLARTYRQQSLSERLAGAEQERMRGMQAQATGLDLAKLKAQLATNPEELRFQTYWGTSARNRGG